MMDQRTESTVVSRVEAAVAAAPSTPCLQVADETLDYGALWSRSDRVARLLDRHGVQPGDRVAAMVPKCTTAVALYLGCLRAGAIYLPLNPSYSDREVGFVLDDAAPSVVVADPDRVDTVRDAIGADAARAVFSLGTGPNDFDRPDSLDRHLDALEETPPPAEDRRCLPKAEDPAAILYTSGTTGTPKGVVLSHGNLVSNADVLVAAWRFTSQDVLVHALPIFHVHGLFVALHCALFAGAAIRFLDRFASDEVIAQLPGATVLMGVPTHYSRLLSMPALTPDTCRSMRLFTSGSAPLSPETHRAFSARTGHTILERYGMTEAGMITSNPYDGERTPGSVGFPLPGVETRIVSEVGTHIDGDDVGELEIRGPNVFTGYWQRDEATTTAFTGGGWLRTGDLVRRASDGRFWIVGRAKDLVITGGMNVYPAEVENVIDAVEGVAESAVIGVPHADFGEAVLGVVARESGAEGIDADSLLASLRTEIAGYKRPKAIVFVNALPRNTMGKVKKNALRNRFQDHFQRPIS